MHESQRLDLWSSRNPGCFRPDPAPLVGIAPILVPLAAVGLALIMVGAATVEFRRHEYKHVLLNLTYLSLAAFVAWGRFW